MNKHTNPGLRVAGAAQRARARRTRPRRQPHWRPQFVYTAPRPQTDGGGDFAQTPPRRDGRRECHVSREIGRRGLLLGCTQNVQGEPLVEHCLFLMQVAAGSLQK